MPKEVAESAAPMMKVSTAPFGCQSRKYPSRTHKGSIPYPYPKYNSRYESPIGKQTPVAAARTLRRKFCFNRSSLTCRPPAHFCDQHQYQSSTRSSNTFKYDQDQANIPNGKESLLPRVLQDIRQRFAIDNPNGNLTNNTGTNDLSRNPFCY